MWVKVDDGFPEHPKVIEAGRHLGTYGRGRVIAIWQVAICYCNRNLTDGFIDEPTVRTWTLYDKRPLDVALVMAGAGLMARVEGGFRFHDYHDYQPSAKERKARLKKDRDRKRAERLAKLGVQADVPTDVQPLSARTSKRNPLYPTRPVLSTCTHTKVHRAPRGRFPQPVENLRVLKALIWREVHAAYGDPSEDFTYSNVAERLKVVAARAGLVYSSEFFRDQLEVAMTRVPRQRGARSAA